MLTYPDDIEEKLGVARIFELVGRQCKSGHGVEILRKVKPSSRVEDIVKWLDQADEMSNILDSGKNLPSREFQDLRVFLAKIKVLGSFLQPGDFWELGSLLRLLGGWVRFLKKHQEEYPQLSALARGLVVDAPLMEAIRAVIDERGQVRDSASPELASVRLLLAQKKKAVRDAVNKVLRRVAREKWTGGDSSATVRDSRLVIPVKAEHKRHVQGFVHDESATGQTVFLEPIEALRLNNEARELQYREKREIIKLLTRLSDRVRESMEDLKKGAEFIGMMDFVHAKAMVSKWTEGARPTVSKAPVAKWRGARHPLLWMAHKDSGKPTVPLSLELSRRENRILVISGPNAGGKSVALKTIGLLQYLFQCGFLTSAHESSTFGVFGSIFLDIGDTQSLENDLSTYSSHLVAMKHFSETVDKNSLFLIDEFGTGTEPQFGGAIAEAILGNLNAREAFGVVTTHYQNLKKFGENKTGVVNAAMKYDVRALEPLFELEVGRPGSSFAFEIAKKIGLPTAIIEQAKEMADAGQVDYERLVNGLEAEKAKFEKLTEKAKKEGHEAAKLKSDYEVLKKTIEEDRKGIIRDAKTTAGQIIEGANKEIERTIREIKESKADKEKTKEARARLNEHKAAHKEETESTNDKPKREAIGPGDYVAVEGQGASGEVMNVRGKKAQVRFGNIISFIALDKLTRSDGKEAEKAAPRKSANMDILGKKSRFSGELDVRGIRAEEALPMVDAHVDQALLLDADRVRIIHGKGHGILRKVIRAHLKGHGNVRNAVDDRLEMGGDGVTIVTFK